MTGIIFTHKTERGSVYLLPNTRSARSAARKERWGSKVGRYACPLDEDRLVIFGLPVLLFTVIPLYILFSWPWMEAESAPQIVLGALGSLVGAILGAILIAALAVGLLWLTDRTIDKLSEAVERHPAAYEVPRDLSEAVTDERDGDWVAQALWETRDPEAVAEVLAMSKVPPKAQKRGALGVRRLLHLFG